MVRTAKRADQAAGRVYENEQRPRSRSMFGPRSVPV
jgi:hypothetical protein